MHRVIFSWAFMALIGAMSAPVGAAPQSVEPFGLRTWMSLQRQLDRPAVVVFSTTDCSHCPATIAAVDAERRRLSSPPWPPLVVVVMDVQPTSEAGAALLKNPRYASVDRLMAFDDQPAALRHEVDPRWSGVTPLVGMFIPGRPVPEMTLGTPSAQAFHRLYGAAKSPALGR